MMPSSGQGEPAARQGGPVGLGARARLVGRGSSRRGESAVAESVAARPPTATLEQARAAGWEWARLGPYSIVLKLGLLGLLALFFLQPGPIGGPPPSPTSGDTPLSAGRPLVQPFVGSYPGLYGVLVRVANVPSGTTRQVAFVLRAVDTGEEVYSAVVPVSKPGELWFEFDPVADSAGRSFAVELTSPEAPSSDAPTIGLSPRRGTASAPARIAGQPIGESLDYRVYYRATLAQELTAIFGRLASGRSGVLGWPGVYWLALAAYLGVCGAIIAVAIGRFGQDERS